MSRNLSSYDRLRLAQARAVQGTFAIGTALLVASSMLWQEAWNVQQLLLNIETVDPPVASMTTQLVTLTTLLAQGAMLKMSANFLRKIFLTVSGRAVQDRADFNSERLWAKEAQCNGSTSTTY